MKQPVSIIMPVFNEERTIERILEELFSLSMNCEIIVVDDSSNDCSEKLIRKFPVRYFRNEINLGYGASLKKGITEAHYNIIVTIDADGEPTFNHEVQHRLRKRLRRES